MNSFIGWIGGKRQLRKEIIARFPADGVGRYIEVFGGAGWVLFGKDKVPNQLEVYNDINGSLVNLFQGVNIENKDFADLIQVYDRKDALFYPDPPYVGTEVYYDSPFKTEDHQRLVEQLKHIKGRFILSYKGQNDDDSIRNLYAWCNVETVIRKNTLAGNGDNRAPFAELIIKNF